MRTNGTALALAGDRTHPESSFTDGLAYVARRVVLGAPGLNPSDKQFLFDVARGDGRYQLRSVQRMLALSAHCNRPEDAEALAEYFRGIVVKMRPAPICPLVAFDMETRAQGHADLWQWRYARKATEATALEVADALRRQLACTRLAIDAVVAT